MDSLSEVSLLASPLAQVLHKSSDKKAGFLSYEIPMETVLWGQVVTCLPVQDLVCV